MKTGEDNKYIHIAYVSKTDACAANAVLQMEEAATTWKIHLLFSLSLLLSFYYIGVKKVVGNGWENVITRLPRNN